MGHTCFLDKIILADMGEKKPVYFFLSKFGLGVEMLWTHGFILS